MHKPDTVTQSGLYDISIINIYHSRHTHLKGERTSKHLCTLFLPNKSECDDQ